MKNLFNLVILLVVFSCDKPETNNFEIIDFEKTVLDCINKASRQSGTLTVKITSSQEYDSLYHSKYTKPLETWLNNNYNSLVEGVIRNYPNATPEQYDSIIKNDYVFNFAPFKWVRDCVRPDIDFSNYTLLGQSISAGGCSTPKLVTEIQQDKNKNQLTFLTKIETFGTCEIGFSFYEWILVDKLNEGCEIIYKTEFLGN